MANALFDPGREGFLAGEIDWDTAVIKMALVRGYTFSAAHKFVSDVTGAGGTLVVTSGAFGARTVPPGAAGAAGAPPRRRRCRGECAARHCLHRRVHGASRHAERWGHHGDVRQRG